MRSNCLLWSLSQVTTKGGRIEKRPSARWCGGCMFVWIDPTGQGWHYGPDPAVYGDDVYVGVCDLPVYVFFRGVVERVD